MEKFEIYKSNTIQFEIVLDKKRFSDAVLDDISNLDKNLLEPILFEDIDDKKKLKSLKEYLDYNKNNLKDGLYDYCIEEYKEIKDDLNFKKSKDGKLIIEVENWVIKTRKKAEKELKNFKVFIGRSFLDPKELIIGVIIKNVDEENTIKSFFLNENPPVAPILKC